MKKLLLLFITVNILIIPNINASEFKIHSNNAILYNVEEKTIMYQKNPDEKAQIASLTKVMSALTIIDKKPDLNKKIKMSDVVDYKFLKKKNLMISTLDKDKEYSYKDLLYSFIMESAADAGYALVLDTSSNEDEFVNEMNKLKDKIGMKSSHFSNPVGLDDPLNYSTMKDMLKLTRYALNNPTMKEILSTFKYKTNDNTDIYHSLAPYVNKKTKNKIAKSLYMDYLKGGKTGTEDIPGHALLSYAEKNGSTYILITTNAKDNIYYPEHVEDAKTIYSYYFNTYGYKTLAKKGFIADSIKTKYVKEKKINIIVNEDIKYFTDKSFDENKVVLRFEGVKEITPKYKKGDKIGNLYVYYDNNLIKTIEMKMPTDVHITLLGLIQYNKYIIIAGLSYLFIIISTIVIVKRIKKEELIN